MDQLLASNRKFCGLSVTVITVEMAETLAQLGPFSTSLVYNFTVFQTEQKAQNLC